MLYIPFLLWALGTCVAWPFVYFGFGFRDAKKHHGVDWREFLGPFITRWIFWPVFVARYFGGVRERAVVQLDGVETREVVDLSNYDVSEAEGVRT